jgi:hypothetical protein
MALVIPNQSEADSLEVFVNKLEPEDIILRLFTNDVTPGDSTTATDFTEASGSGYAAITLTGAGWDSAIEGNPSTITHPEQTFTLTGALDPLYGYYMTRAVSGRIVGAGRFDDGPYTIPSGGGSVTVTPTIISQSQE